MEGAFGQPFVEQFDQIAGLVLCDRSTKLNSGVVHHTMWVTFYGPILGINGFSKIVCKALKPIDRNRQYRIWLQAHIPNVD